MPKVYVMRRANGEFFTLEANRLAVWIGEESLCFSRTHNRELDLFQPLAIEGRILPRIKQIAEKSKLWLVTSTTLEANLNDGRWIDWPEIEKILAQPIEEKEEPINKRVRASVQEYQFH